MKSVFPYPGGKSYLAPWIIEHIPDHDCYIELFGGSASVLVNKPKSRVEIFNDLDGDIVHFFDVLRTRDDELREWLETVPFAKELHERWGRQWYDGWRPDDDIKRAGVFFFLRRSQYAGKYKTFSGFRSASTTCSAKTWVRDTDKLEKFAQRLREVQIEQRDYAELFDRFDSEDVFYYADPPYVKEGDALYTHGEFDHERFVDTLESAEGKWMVSYMDLPPGLEDYYVVERGATQHMNKGHEERRDEATERLIMNFDPDEVTPFAGADQSNLEAFAGADD